MVVTYAPIQVVSRRAILVVTFTPTQW